MRRGVEAYIEAFISLMMRAEFFFLFSVGLFLCLLALRDSRVKWFLIAAVVYIASVSHPLSTDHVSVLVGPLESLRDYGRPLSGIILLVLGMVSVFKPGAPRRASSLAMFAFLAFEILFSTRMVIDGNSGKGLLSLVLFGLIFWLAGPAMSGWVHDRSGARKLLGSMMLATFIFCLAATMQLMISPDAILLKGRLLGTTGNAQHAALLLSTSLLPCLFFSFDSSSRQSTRLFARWLSVVVLIFLLWTGSRTGLGVAVLGAGICYRKHFFRYGFSLVLVVGIALMMAELLPESEKAVYRYVQGKDTRSHVWAAMWAMFLKNPLFGASFEIASKSENSYLHVAARFGLLGLAPLFAMICLVALSLRRVLTSARVAAEAPDFRDLVFGGLVSIAAGAFFEGFLLGVLSWPVFFLYFYLSLLSWLDHKSREAI